MNENDASKASSQGMASPAQRARPEPSVVVAAVDFTELGELALEKAIALASASSAVPHVLTVARSMGHDVYLDTQEAPNAMTEESALEYLVGHVQNRIEAYEKMSQIHVGRVLCHLRLGDPAHQIAQFASDSEADVIVMGTHGRSGVKRLLLGSVAEKVVRLAPCPVFVVRPKEVRGARAEVPEIEPPCPQCVQTRRASNGAEMWCEQHRSGLGRRHTYSFVSRNASAHINEPLVFPMREAGTSRR